MIYLDPRDEEWKCLIVLDSCRYDYFKDVNFIKGKLLKVNFRCSNTIMWYDKYWAGKDNDDTVLIHGTYFVDRYGKFFHKAYKMWNYDNMLDIGQQIAFVENVLKNIKDKRVIIHFLQPHLPFCNPRGKKLMDKLGIGMGKKGHDYSKITAYGEKGNWKEVIDIYKEEIKYILNKLVNSDIDFDIITGDHGVRIGEDNTYLHHANCPQVKMVPWLIVDKLFKKKSKEE